MPSRSWARSREARLWAELSPLRAGIVLKSVYRDQAAAEALLRAYLAARDGDGDTARFWTEVHRGIDGKTRALRQR